MDANLVFFMTGKTNLHNPGIQLPDSRENIICDCLDDAVTMLSGLMPGMAGHHT
jgi:hypothetical protein